MSQDNKEKRFYPDPDENTVGGIGVKIPVYIAVVDDTGNLSCDAYGNIEIAERAIIKRIKDDYEDDYPEINFSLSFDEVVIALQEASDYTINIKLSRSLVPATDVKVFPGVNLSDIINPTTSNGTLNTPNTPKM
jgi:hypothetical protein